MTARTIPPLLLALVIGAACTRQSPLLGEVPGSGVVAATATVVSVIDGDTIEVRFPGGGLERVRLLGIDTPETVKPNSPVECWGPESSQRTRELLPEGTAVLVQRDREARDRYGRLLLYVWREDGLFVNETLLAEGYARTLFIAPNTAHRPTLAAATSSARTADIGVWSHCRNTPP